MAFPPDTTFDLEKFYGRHTLGPDGRPTAKWESSNLVLIKLPYPMTLSWDHSVQVKRMRCHKKVGTSLQGVLEQLLQHYGSFKNVQKARMHLTGGCFEYRRISGSGRLSTHAWGAGIDLDPDRNPLGKAYDEHAGMMPKAVISIFEAAGWKWGGTFSRPDCMHFQATV